MAFFDTRQQRAAVLIFVLGAWLLVAVWPYSAGLVGGPVLYVMFAPAHKLLARWLPASLAALVTVLAALVLILGPGLSFVGILVAEAQNLAGGFLDSPVLGQLAHLRLGRYPVGDQIVAAGQALASWIAGNALGLIGTATRLAIQLTIAAFGLYYLLLAPRAAWQGVRPFIPFSTPNAELLRRRFQDVTFSTLLGTFATALIQGLLVALAFWVLGLSNVLLWGVLTAIFSILPVVGGGLIWGPGAVALALAGRWPSAIGLVIWGILVVGQVDTVVRPWAFRRYARIHPFITVIGAFAGIRYFGLMGIVIGPLAVSYFFELIRMYREEYLEPEAAAEAMVPPLVSGPHVVPTP